MKKTYQITFKAELSEDDVKAMKGCFYQAMSEAMNIDEVYGLNLEEIASIPPVCENISEVKEALYACKTINEVHKLLDNLPRKLGEWRVDIVSDGVRLCYEVTNEWFDTMNEELCSNSYQLEIEVEEDDC